MVNVVLGNHQIRLKKIRAKGIGMKLTLSLPRVINFKFPQQPHQKYCPHHMKNSAFHSFLRGKMIILPILTTSLIHFS